MHASRTREVLYDSETVLRLVAHELKELRDQDVLAIPAADRAGEATAPVTSAAGALLGLRRPPR